MGTLRRSLLGLALASAFVSADPPAKPDADLPALPEVKLPESRPPAERPAGREEAAFFEKPEKAEPGAFLLEGEFFLWAPRRRAQDYAILGTNPNFAPLGTVKTLEGGYDPGLRIGAGYRFASGVEATGVYTHWHTSADEFLTATAPEKLFPTLTHPVFVSEATTARANNNVNMNVFDVELARRFEIGEGTKVRAFFGPRFANLDQSFTATYEGAVVASDTVRRKLTFDGGGMRVGGAADFRVLDSIGLFLRGSAGLMTGRLRSTLEETADSQPIVNVVERFNKVVPTADLGIGLSYNAGGMKMSFGYEFHNWFGVVEGIDFVDDMHPSKMSRRYSDLGFDGVFFRAELAF
ncbi:MAG: Lpg1974 family pore-forming outer membrane protein [Gemmataceae bacterium]